MCICDMRGTACVYISNCVLYVFMLTVSVSSCTNICSWKPMVTHNAPSHQKWLLRLCWIASLTLRKQMCGCVDKDSH